MVERRRFDLAGGRLVLAVAGKCKAWPLREQDGAVLEASAARAAGCRLRRYAGAVDVWVQRGDGAWERVEVIQTDAAGVLEVDLRRVDRLLRTGRGRGLSDYTRLALGSGGWAGTVDLERLRAVTALWHFAWIQRGRGAPGLFAHLYPDHPRTPDARALAVEAVLARQERDFRAVADGELRPELFLERHAWSPYRTPVREMLEPGSRASGAGGASPPEGRSGGPPRTGPSACQRRAVDDGCPAPVPPGRSGDRGPAAR